MTLIFKQWILDRSLDRRLFYFTLLLLKHLLHLATISHFLLQPLTTDVVTDALRVALSVPCKGSILS